MCTCNGSSRMHKALRSLCGIPQAPNHTSISPVTKMRTERHREELISHLLMFITWGVRTSLDLPALET